MDDHLVQEPTNQSDGVLLSPYDLYSNEVPRVSSILHMEPFMKITVKNASLQLNIDNQEQQRRKPYSELVFRYA